MIDEQIKQNAEAYAIENYVEYDEHYYTDHSGSNMCHVVSEKAFIAGAKSLAEEIKELEARLHLADNIINEQRVLIDKLRNPWINTQEQLPEVHQDVLIELNGSVIRNDYISVGDINYMKDSPELFTRWMLTPKPNKL